MTVTLDFAHGPLYRRWCDWVDQFRSVQLCAVNEALDVRGDRRHSSSPVCRGKEEGDRGHQLPSNFVRL